MKEREAWVEESWTAMSSQEGSAEPGESWSQHRRLMSPRNGSGLEFPSCLIGGGEQPVGPRCERSDRF